VINRTLIVAMIAVLACAALQGCGGAESRRATALERGRQYLEQENYAKARVEFSNALQIEPNDADARYYSAYAAEKLGDLRAGAQGYQAALNVDGTHALATAALARLFVFSGLPDRGAEMVEKGLAAHPDSPDLKIIRAAAELSKGDEQAAEADAAAVLAARPDDEYAVALLAGIYRGRGELDRAAQLVEGVVAAKPNSLDLLTVLAQLKLDLGDKPAAEAHLKKLIELRPTDARYRQRLVAFYASTGQPDAAEATLRDVIALDPKPVEPKIALLNYLAAQRSFDSAEAELGKLLDQYGDDAQLKVAAGQFYEAHNLPQDADRIYNEVIKREGDKPAGLGARNRLATLAIRQNKVADARPLVEHVLEANPRDNDALVLRAALALADGHALDAITDLRAVLRDQPDNAAVLRTLARAHGQNNEPDLARENYRRAVEADPANNETRLEFATYLGRSGQNDEAKTLVDAVLAAEPQNVSALEIKCRTLLGARDAAGGAAVAASIIGAQPESALGYYLQGLAREMMHNADGAAASYEQALEKQPRGAEPLGALARVLVNANRKPEARERLERVLAQYPDHAVAANLLSEIMLSDRDFDRAVALADQAIGLDAQWWVPYRTKALGLLAKGAKDDAKAVYAEGFEKSGYSPSLGMDLAALYERDHEFERAIEVYEGMHRANPASAPLANNLAMLLSTYRDDDASHEKAHELVRGFRDSDNPAYLNTYGWVRYRQGQLGEAITYLRRASSATPNDGLMHYHLGMALLANGERDQARAELEKALSTDQAFPGKEAAKHALESLPRTPG
jgi:tetratricopeptide (TPR) repeat protein